VLATYSESGNGGAITLLTAGGDIRTDDLFASSGGTGTGGNIKLSVTEGTGAIDTTIASLTSFSAGGNGGAIELSTVGGNIITRNVNSFSLADGDGGNIKLSVTGGTGAIDTTNGSVNSYSKGGNGGAIELSTVGGNIRTNNVNSFSYADGDGGNIKLSVTGGTGAIDTTKGSLNSYSKGGNGGAIELSTVGGNIIAKDIVSYAKDGTGTGGNIKLSVTGGTGAIDTTNGSLNSSSSSDAAGDIAIATPNQVRINGIDANGLPGTGNISISGNEIGFSGAADSVQSKGTLSIQPFSPNVGIRFQAGLADDPQAIDLDTPFLSALANGFSEIVFGTNTTTGNITVDNLPIVFKDPVSFNTQGTIFVNPNQSISGTDNASITLNATTNNLNGNITTQSQNITINGNNLVGDSVLVSNGNSAGGNILFNNNIDGSGNLTLETGTANIDVKGAVGNTTELGNLTVNSAGTTTFNAVKATSFTTNAGGTTELKGDVTTTGPQTYGDAVTIANNPTLSGSDISFNNTVDGSSALTVKEGTGNVTCYIQ
jgi:hypothetical protein